MTGARVAFVALALLLPACGPDPAPEVEVPSWAKVAPEQIAEAKKHGVPVAFENDLGMRFVLIPAGTFLMGSPEDEEGRGEDETQHEVTISRPYYMSIYEVTNGQYRHFKPDHNSRRIDDFTLNDDLQPVVSTSADEAVAYASWLSHMDEDHAYRLPTEAEWEYACRAGTVTLYSFGDDLREMPRHANIGDKRSPAPMLWGRGEFDDGHAVSSHVGAYLPNPWGCFDMHGNVGEICTVIDAPPPKKCRVVVSRGGGWSGPPKYHRSASRIQANFLDDVGSFTRGFRLVSPLPEAGERSR